MDGERLTALPSAWMDRLFLRLQTIYGSRMSQMWGDVPAAEVKAAWADELGKYAAEDIRKALEAIGHAYQDYPPTLFQFSALCRDAMRARGQVAQKLTHVRYGEVDPRVLAEVHRLLDAMKKSDPRDWARRIMRRIQEGERVNLIAEKYAREALGL